MVSVLPGHGYGSDDSFTIAEHPPLLTGRAVLAIKRFADPVCLLFSGGDRSDGTKKTVGARVRYLRFGGVERSASKENCETRTRKEKSHGY
jgi:hypothetical protein